MDCSFRILQWILIPLVLAIYFIWIVYYKNKRILKFCKYQNGPKAYPLIGNLNILLRKNVFEGLIQLKEIYSLPANIWIWNDYYYVTDSPQEVKAVLSNSTKSFSKAPFYDDLIRVILGNTFALTPLSEIKKWKHERSIVGKAFSPSLWPHYTPVFHEKANKLLKKLGNTSSLSKLTSYLSKIVYEIAMENFMDTKTDCIENYDKLEASLNELVDMLSRRALFGKLVPHWLWKHFTEEGRKFKHLLDYIENRLKQLIDEKRREYLDTKEFVGSNNKAKLIELLLLKEEIKFTTSDILRQICAVYFTSIETSAFLMAYTLLYLGAHQKIQEKVYQEILSHVGCREIIPEDLSRLKYLEQTILEAMRLLPVLPVAGRRITDDIDLGQKTIPKGANVLIAPYLVHRNEKYWPEPETFNPDRFSSENTQKLEAGSYIPFLLGARDCVGRYYTLAQAKIFLANILRNFKVFADPKMVKDMKFNLFIVMKPICDLDIKFQQRNGKE